jgi:dTDP-4-dehydrorhamnose reductase
MPAPIRRSAGGPGGGGAAGGGPPTRVSLRETTVASSAMGHASGSFVVLGGVWLDKVISLGGQDSSGMQRLLVTGGCGYLGRELVRLGRARGWSVRATWFRQPPAGEADWVHVDLRDPEAALRALDGVDAVVHTAYRQGEGEWEANVDGTRAVAAAADGRRLVHLSTDLVFDGTRGRYREGDPTAPVSSYGRSKAEAERIAGGLHPGATLVRTSLIYGGAEPGPQERLAREGTRFFVDEIRSPVQVTDLAEALLELLPLDVPGPLHLGGADDVSRFDFAVLLGADPRAIERAHTTPGRAPDVSLDSSRAAALLRTRLRGVHEVLGGAGNGPPRAEGP